MFHSDTEKLVSNFGSKDDIIVPASNLPHPETTEPNKFYQNLNYQREISILTNKVENLNNENKNLLQTNQNLIDQHDQNQKHLLTQNLNNSGVSNKTYSELLDQLNNTELLEYKNPANLAPLLSRHDTLNLYEKKAEIEDLFENVTELNQKVNSESKLQTEIAGKYKKLYETERTRNEKLKVQLDLAYSQIQNLQEQIVKHGMLHDEFVKTLDKYDY